MAGKKPTMRENISSRPTDKYGNRATDADLGIGAGAAAARKAAAEKIMRREGTTSPGGGRPAKASGGMGAVSDRDMKIIKAATKMPAKTPSGMGAMSDRDMQIIKAGARSALLRMPTPSKPAKAPAVKAPKAPQIIRTTTNMKPTPMGKKR